MAERILWSTTTQSRATRCPLPRPGGFDVVGEAAEGYEAIELARSLQPQLVLLDLTMPGLDGLSALPGLREAAPRAEIVVLLQPQARTTICSRRFVPARRAT